MKKIIVTGALGQIGSELIIKLRTMYGTENVLATDIKQTDSVMEGPFEVLDVTDVKKMHALTKSFGADTMMHMAALLSAKAEENPLLAWNLNMGGLMNALEVSRELEMQFFTPSSIGAFGPSTPKKGTPQDTLQRPTTMYGVNKVAGELLCDYYHKKFGLDTRSVRFPGLISHVSKPGGGTTDYAVEIYYKALETGRYTSPIAKGTYMDMMYMPDALQAITDLLEANPEKLIHRNAFNVKGMSFEPSEIAASIQKHIPSFEMSYDVNSELQSIADSWPDSIDISVACEEWGFKSIYDLDSMTIDMLENLKLKMDK
ncbi:L-threonine 3-dehydrogenase [Sporosarcina siberiensis]|uniref:L-threonine 3-dehydrogenase n=1 Tax=Sporosarcina siberiensis TaxID=1365606 RepID=A0ABW4SIV2_9BACL